MNNRNIQIKAKLYRTEIKSYFEGEMGQNREDTLSLRIARGNGQWEPKSIKVHKNLYEKQT